MTRCLLVDDDADIRLSLGKYLGGFGMKVVSVASAAAMHKALRGQSFDIILLDRMLPDADGLDLCQTLLTSQPAPVILLTAMGDLASRVLGLEWGADDYIAKPFEPRELVARMHALLRRERRRNPPAAGPAHTQARFGGWCFDLTRHQLVAQSGVVVPLSSAEYRLLMALVEHPGRVLSRERLIVLTRAPGVEVNDRSIDLSISRLRRKLGDVAQEGNLIRTLRGEGYLFDAEVQW